MRLSILAGAGVALLTGAAIAAQSTLTSRAGSQIGDIRTGLLTNALGGIIAGSLVLVWLLLEGPQAWRVPRLVVGITSLAGLLGILIITGISFSLQRAGIAAGLASVIVGQLVLSTVIDTFGFGGTEQIPLTGARVAGLVLLGVGVYFMLPRP
jgi:transporter family-2 protein